MNSSSYRDPHGRVRVRGGRVFRELTKQGLDNWNVLVQSGLKDRFERNGYLVRSRQLSSDEARNEFGENVDVAAVLEHDVLPVVSYPYEWSFQMLRDAGLHQLDVLEEALRQGLTLQDGSSYNVQFLGATPLFIDVMSLVPADSSQLWHGHKQFCEHFLHPLMVTAHTGVSFRPFLRSSLEGIDVSTTARLLGNRRFLSRDALFYVALGAKLDGLTAPTKGSIRDDLSKLGDKTAASKAMVARLRSTLAHLDRRRRSAWVDYADDCHYSAEDRRVKREFVRDALIRSRSRMLLDLGANTGEYAVLAAPLADQVVAVDADEVAVDAIYEAARSSKMENILPIVLDITNPSPSQGWRGAERFAWQERISPDCVLALGLVHHLALTKNIPLNDLVDWITAQAAHLIVEFITKDDTMAQSLLRNKDDNYPDYDVRAFEKRLESRGRVIRRVPLPMGTRVLYEVDVRPQ